MADFGNQLSGSVIKFANHCLMSSQFELRIVGLRNQSLKVVLTEFDKW